MWLQGLSAIFIDTKNKAPKAKMSPITNIYPRGEEKARLAWTPACVGVPQFVFMCVWVICIVLFMFYELAVKKWWDKSGENFHSAGIKSGFYSKLASVTAAHCNALSFQEQKHFL